MPCYPTKALDALRTDNIDIAFLNIEMPLMDGIGLAEQLLELKPDLEIVFITVYKDHAVKAFEMNWIICFVCVL